jgi:hypothetical protein
MRKLTTTTLTLFACLTSFHTTTSAETILVPLGQQGGNQQTISRPHQGMTKDQVQRQYGEPKEWRNAVGDPPISTWIYDGFTVYFEYNHVIHSVINHRPVKQG